MSNCEVFVHYAHEALLEKTLPFRKYLQDPIYIKCGFDPSPMTQSNTLVWSDFSMHHTTYPESFLGYQAYVLAAKSESPYVALLEYDCKVYPDFYTELSECIERNVDLLSFTPARVQDVFVLESNEFTWAVCEYLQELNIKAYDLTRAYEVWAPTPAILVKTPLLQEFLDSSFFQDFKALYHDKYKFAHQIERLLSVYFMYKGYKLEGPRRGVIHHCMANSHGTASTAIQGNTHQRIDNVLEMD